MERMTMKRKQTAIRYHYHVSEILYISIWNTADLDHQLVALTLLRLPRPRLLRSLTTIHDHDLLASHCQA